MAALAQLIWERADMADRSEIATVDLASVGLIDVQWSQQWARIAALSFGCIDEREEHGDARRSTPRRERSGRTEKPRPTVKT